MATQPTTYTPPAGGWNPNSVEDYFKSQGMAWTPQNAAAQFEKVGLGTAASYMAAGKNNAAQNMALLAKLKGYTGTTGTGVSGSGAVGQGLQAGKATGSALNTVVPPPTPNGAPANAPPPVTPPPTADPYVAELTNTLNSQIAQETTAYNQNVTDAIASYAPQYSKTLKDANSAAAGAAATWDAANPGSSGSDKEQFIASVKSTFDNTLSEMAASHQAIMDNLNQTHAANLTSLQANYESTVASYNQQQITNQLNQEKLQVSLDRLGISKEELAISAGRLGVSQDALVIAEQNATTSEQRLALEQLVAASQTTTTKPGLLKQLWATVTGGDIVSTTQKTPGGGGGASAPTTSNGVDLSSFNSD